MNSLVSAAMAPRGPGCKNSGDVPSAKYVKNFTAVFIEVDEFFIGGLRSGKRERGAESRTIIIIAVERPATEKRMGRIRLHIALDFSRYSLETFNLENIAPGSMISTDECRSYNVIVKNDTIAKQQIKASADFDELCGAHLATC